MVVFPQKEYIPLQNLHFGPLIERSWSQMKLGGCQSPRCDTDPLHLGSAKMPKIEEFHYWNLWINAHK